MTTSFVNMNPIQPIVVASLASQKVSAEHPLNYIRFRSELKVRVAASTAKRYIDVPEPTDRTDSWTFLIEHLQALQDAHIEGIRNPVEGVLAPPSLTSQQHLDLKNASDSLQRYNDELEKETNAVKELYAYIRTVVPDETHLAVDTYITEHKAMRPRLVYAEILQHLKNVCQQGSGNLREHILIEYQGLGTAITKPQLLSLIGAAAHWLTLLEQFDIDNPTGKPVFSVVDKIDHLLKRIIETGELRDIRSKLDDKAEDASLVWEDELNILRRSCKKSTMTVIQLHDIQVKKGAAAAKNEPITTHNMALAATGGHESRFQQQPSSYSSSSSTVYASQDHNQQPAQEFGNGFGRQQYQSQPDQMQPFQQFSHPASQGQGYGQHAFSGQGSGQAFQPQTSGHSAYLAYQQQATVPGSYNQPSYPAAAQEVPDCFAYPYCNRTLQGCRYRHVTKPGHTKAEDDRTQAAHDEYLAKIRSSGSRQEGGAPSSLVRQREHSSGGTPARAPSKFNRYDSN